MLNKRNLILIAAVFCLGLFSLIYFRYIGFFTVNVEPACISGKYFYIDRLNKKLKDGGYAAFRFKGSKLYKKGHIFLKIVGCTAGQRILTKGYKYYCGGRLIDKACIRHKNCLPGWLSYNEIIPPGKFFAAGTAWDSYDSKYWGLADTKSVIGRAYKIIGGKPF